MKKTKLLFSVVGFGSDPTPLPLDIGKASACYIDGGKTKR
jgi:hypothetical protein